MGEKKSTYVNPFIEKIKVNLVPVTSLRCGDIFKEVKDPKNLTADAFQKQPQFTVVSSDTLSEGFINITVIGENQSGCMISKTNDMVYKVNYQNDPVNHPSHYMQGNIEVIDFINDQKMNYNLGNALKYVCRCNYKGKKIEDLKKAIWYINKEIEIEEKNKVVDK